MFGMFDCTVALGPSTCKTFPPPIAPGPISTPQHVLKSLNMI